MHLHNVQLLFLFACVFFPHIVWVLDICEHFSRVPYAIKNAHKEVLYIAKPVCPGIRFCLNKEEVL